MSSKGKRGQFYLITAIIISIIIIGFVALTNYSQGQTSTKLYDLGEELGIENSNVLDFGIVNGYNETEMAELLTNLTEFYASYIEEGNDLYFLFGNTETITVVSYTEVDTSINVSVGGTDFIRDITGGDKFEETFPSAGGNEVIITIEGVEYKFELNAGQSFYFVISQDLGDEQYVITG